MHSTRHALSPASAMAVEGAAYLLRGIAEALVHVGGDASVPQEVDHPVAEVAKCPV